MIDDAGLSPGGGSGEHDLHTEHAGAKHDDAFARRHSREHPFRFVEVAQHGDPARERGVARVEGGGIRCGYLAVSAHPGDAIERGNVGAGTGGEHEPVVGQQGAVTQGHRAAAAQNGRDTHAAVQVHACRAGAEGIGDFEALPVGIADGVGEAIQK